MTDTVDDAVRNLESVFGGVELSVRRVVPEPGRLSLAALRGKAKAALNRANAPVAFQGESPARYIVAMNQPDQESIRAKRPAVGKEGLMVRAQLDLAGLRDGAFWCYGYDDKELFWPQVQAAWCQIMLLVGEDAIRMWRDDVNPRRVNGNVYLWKDQYLVIPCMTEKVSQAQYAMKTLAAIVEGEATALSFMDDMCAECNEYLTRIDRDGVGWCNDHR